MSSEARNDKKWITRKAEVKCAGKTVTADVVLRLRCDGFKLSSSATFYGKITI